MTLIWAGKSWANVLEYLYPVAPHGHTCNARQKKTELRKIINFKISVNRKNYGRKKHHAWVSKTKHKRVFG